MNKEEKNYQVVHIWSSTFYYFQFVQYRFVFYPYTVQSSDMRALQFTEVARWGRLDVKDLMLNHFLVQLNGGYSIVWSYFSHLILSFFCHSNGKSGRPLLKTDWNQNQGNFSWKNGWNKNKMWRFWTLSLNSHSKMTFCSKLFYTLNYILQFSVRML